MKNAFFAVLLFAATLTSCDKEDKEETKETTKTDVLVKSAWRLDNAQITILGVSQNVTALIDPCLADNTLTFNANGSGTVDEASLKCVPTAPQTTAFNWSFGNNETTMNISGNLIAGVSGQIKLLELSDTRLSLSKDTSVQGITGVYTVNLKH